MITTGEPIFKKNRNKNSSVNSLSYRLTEITPLDTNNVQKSNLQLSMETPADSCFARKQQPENQLSRHGPSTNPVPHNPIYWIYRQYHS